MLLLAGKYFLFIFIASLGVLQIVFARRRLRGLCLFSKPLWCYIFSGLIIPFSFAWFFLSEDRAKPGLEGAQQFFLFSLASLCSFLICLLLPPLLWRGKPASGKGIEVFRDASFFDVMRRR